MQLALLFLMLLQPTQVFPLPFFSYCIYIPLHHPYQSIAAINPGAGDKQNKPSRGEKVGTTKASVSWSQDTEGCEARGFSSAGGNGAVLYVLCVVSHR